MSDPTARALRLLSLLQRRRFWPGAELAARLEVSERTLRRDVDRLRALGYTVDADRGVDGGYRLGASNEGVVLLLDPDEATALAVALHSVAAGTSDLAEASLGALTKVMASLGPAARRRAEAVPEATSFGDGPAGNSPRLAVLDAVASACRDRVRLRFDYRSADGAASRRYVEPYRLVALQRRWYLVAFDIDRDDWRTFRVDRLDAPIASRNTFRPRRLPADDLVEYVRAGFEELRTQHRVELEIDLPAETVRAGYGQWATVTALGRRRCRVVMESDSFVWPTHLLAELDAPFRVVSPPEFERHLRGLADRLQRATTGVPRSRRSGRSAL
ncbi:MAG: YafY family protein [Acidimicrobiales bacterium]